MGKDGAQAFLPSPSERQEVSVPPSGEDTLESEVTKGLVADVPGFIETAVVMFCFAYSYVPGTTVK